MSEQGTTYLSEEDGRPYGEIYGLVQGHVSDADRTGETCPPDWSRGEVVRFFKRLGTVPRSREASRAALRVCMAAREMGDQNGRSMEAVYRDLLLFSGAEGGDGVCTENPRCGECPVNDYCDDADRSPTIKEWPEQERPRERLLERGPDALSDSELLALIIGGGSRDESAVELSRRLLSRMGGFRALANCHAGELEPVKGIGPAKTARIKAALEIAQRYNTEDIQTGMKVTGSRQIYEHFRHRLGDLKKETFFSLLLDTKHRLLAEEKVAVGSLNESVVHPREVFRRAVREGAAAAAFVHNHPSGLPDPSPQDRALTRRLVEAGQLMGIRVLDHVIVADEDYYSFAEHGQLEPDLDHGGG